MTTWEPRIITVPRDTINGNMLRLGRQSRGMRVGTLARLLSIAAREIQFIEQGKLAFPADKIDALCEALNYPRAFFFMEDTPAEWAEAHTFVCNTHAWEDEAYEALSVEHQLRARIRELEREVVRLRSAGGGVGA